MAKAVRQWDVPLQEDELDCWKEQYLWLKCPVTGKDLYNRKSLLGVGLYHAPRFLSEKEKARMIADEEGATLAKLERKRGKVFFLLFSIIFNYAFLSTFILIIVVSRFLDLF